jgi:hypothetical protein
LGDIHGKGEKPPKNNTDNLTENKRLGRHVDGSSSAQETASSQNNILKGRLRLNF